VPDIAELWIGGSALSRGVTPAESVHILRNLCASAFYGMCEYAAEFVRIGNDSRHASLRTPAHERPTRAAPVTPTQVGIHVFTLRPMKRVDADPHRYGGE
jgi:hypothetical protein